MGFLETPKILSFHELICCTYKASLVNGLLTFCDKLECSFLKATLLFFYSHFSTTVKVPLPKT